MADEYVVLKGSLVNGKFVACREYNSRGKVCWEYVTAMKALHKGFGWRPRRLDEATAKQWAKECRGKAILASSIPGLPEYIPQK